MHKPQRNTVGFLCQARDNVAYALSSLMECGWLSMEDAKEIACDWFYNNPNEIFKLGLEKCEWDRVANADVFKEAQNE